MAPKSFKKFQDLLLNFSQTEEMQERKKIEASLWSNYGAEFAVFVLDMSGFSLLTRKYGVAHCLSMVRRMQLTTEPIVRSYGGQMLKYEADNCFAVFPEPLLQSMPRLRCSTPSGPKTRLLQTILISTSPVELTMANC